MTVITYFKDGIRIDGHAKDPVVCHAVSAISQMVSGFVQERDWGNVNVEEGPLEIREIKEAHCSSDLFQAMIIAFDDISSQYPDSVRIERN